MSSLSESTACTAGQDITCNAAVMYEVNKPLVIETITVAPPKKGEVRIRITDTAVCHTDLYTHSGQDSEMVLPCILGHEGAGVVESIGEGVASLSVGDHVIPLYTPECRDCRFCKNPKTNLCPRVRATQGKGLMPDGTSRFSIEKDGKVIAIHHFMGCSTFSEYTVMPEISVAKINPKAPSDKVCLFGCGVTTGYGAVFNNAGVTEGSSAAVFGLGGVGLAVVMGLVEAKAGKIIVVDVNPTKFEMARKFIPADFKGEFICVNPKDHGDKKIQDVLVTMTTAEDGFGGVDFAFECVGSPDLMASCIMSTTRGWGKTVIIGVAPAGTELKIRPFYLVTGRVATGTAMGGVKGRTQVPIFVERYMQGSLKLDEFITHTYKGIDSLNEAFHVMHVPEENCIRPVITY